MAVVGWKNVTYLRGLAMCVVVLNHSVQSAAGLYLWGTSTLEPSQRPVGTAVIVLLRDITPFCVAGFVFASGFIGFRFVRSWQQATALAWQTARIYLIWSTVFYLLFALGRGGLEPLQVFREILGYGPFAAYWFLPLMVQLYLLQPLLMRVVKASPGVALVASGAFQVFVWTTVYCASVQETLPAWVVDPIRFYFHLPMFVLGMLASAHVDAVLGLLSRHRAMVSGFAVAALVARVSETVMVAAQADWGLSALNAGFSSERASNTVLAILIIALLLSRESRASRLTRWFAYVGVRSLGILLMLDPCQFVLYAVIWHAPRLLPWGHHLLAANAEPAPWLLDTGLWHVFTFFAVGLGVPLLVMRCAKKVLGSRVRYLW